MTLLHGGLHIDANAEMRLFLSRDVYLKQIVGMLSVPPLWSLSGEVARHVVISIERSPDLRAMLCISRAESRHLIPRRRREHELPCGW